MITNGIILLIALVVLAFIEPIILKVFKAGLVFITVLATMQLVGGYFQDAAVFFAFSTFSLWLILFGHWVFEKKQQV